MTTDSEELPDGAAGQGNRTSAAQATAAAPTGSTICWYITGAAMAFLAAVAFELLTRRHRPRPADGGANR